MGHVAFRQILESILEFAPVSAGMVDHLNATPLHYMSEFSCSWLLGCVQLLVRVRPASGNDPLYVQQLRWTELLPITIPP